MRQAVIAALAFTLALAVPVPQAEAQSEVTDCNDFDYQEEAQAFYNRNGGIALDRDSDGMACEDLPNRDVPASNEVCNTGGQIRGFNGWISESVNVNVNLRSGASTSSRVVTVLEPGTLVQIHSWRSLPDGRWAWLTTERGQDGWVRSPLVECIEAFGY